MGFFRRIFSSDYRKAVAAEAEGDYLAAARAYALCGDREKVAAMHLARARAETSAEERVKALRDALNFTGPGEETHRTVLRLLGRAMKKQAKALGQRTERGRRLLLEAALVYEEGQYFEKAGDCYLKLGDKTKAAAAYSRAGLVEKVEELLTREEESHSRKRREEELFKDYEAQLQGGLRDAALESLRGCLEAASRKGDYRRLLEDLERRLLTDGKISLQVGEQRLTLVGRFPLHLGRDADCELQVRGPAVSRRHASIKIDDGGQMIVEDAGSHNGTLLNGLQLGAPVPLPRAGALELGPGCEIAFELTGAPDAPGAPAGVRLEVRQGLDRGKLTHAARQALRLDQLLENGPPLSLRFDRGRPVAGAAGGVELLLNSARIIGEIQLIRDDRLQVAGTRIQVLD
jgi:tetratricopeptide (TPR) repeat protein